MRRMLSAMLLLVCLFSAGRALWQYSGRRTGEQAYAAALEIAQSAQPAPTEETARREKTQPGLPDKIWVPAPVEDDPNMDALASLDLDALRQVNPEVVGWIRIPGTAVDFPLLQGEDNQFYLDYTWDLNESSSGSIFLECRNDPAFTDFNTLIFGHNMRDGSMFATLQRYGQQDFFLENPYIYILTDAGVLRYEVFSSFYAQPDSRIYGLSFRQQETRTAFLQLAAEESQIDSGISPAATDRILTLSTCTGWGYTHRRVVLARLPMVEVYEK